MIDPLPCPSCSFANAPGADVCVKCGTALGDTPERVHPGETLRDPDDLTLPSLPSDPDDLTIPPSPRAPDDLTMPPSPLLRAVLRGDTDELTKTRPQPRPVPVVARHEPPVPSVQPAPSPPAPSLELPPSEPEPEPEPAAVPELPPTAAVVSPPPPLTIEQLSPSADQAALLRELATRLHGQKAEPTLRYAGFFLRVFAFLIDAVVLGAFGVPLAAAGYFGLRAGTAMLGHAVPVDADETLLTILMLAWFVMATIYFTVLHRRYGQTIGKSLVGIEVRTLELEKLGVARSLLRTLGYGLSSTFFGFGFFLVALTPRKRAWHDFLAGTCVVRQLPEEAPA